MNINWKNNEKDIERIDTSKKPNSKELHDESERNMGYIAFEEPTPSLIAGNLFQANDIVIKPIFQEQMEELSRRVNENPHDTNAWHEYIELQNEMFESQKNVNEKVKMEILVSICEKAIQNNPSNSSLVEKYMDIVGRMTTVSEVMTKWEQVLRGSWDPFLVVKKLNYFQSSLTAYNTNGMIQLIVATLNDFIQRLNEEKDIEKVISIKEAQKIVIYRLIKLYKETGYTEKCTGSIQAVLDWVFFRPKRESTSLEFEEYWVLSLTTPKIGEYSRLVWNEFFSNQDSGFHGIGAPKIGNTQSPLNLEVHSNDDDTDEPTSKLRKWIETERSLERQSLFSQRSVPDFVARYFHADRGDEYNDGDCEEDPYRIVLFEDIKPVLLEPSDLIQSPWETMKFISNLFGILGIYIPIPFIPSGLDCMNQEDLKSDLKMGNTWLVNSNFFYRNDAFMESAGDGGVWWDKKVKSSWKCRPILFDFITFAYRGLKVIGDTSMSFDFTHNEFTEFGILSLEQLLFKAELNEKIKEWLALVLTTMAGLVDFKYCKNLFKKILNSLLPQSLYLWISYGRLLVYYKRYEEALSVWFNLLSRIDEFGDVSKAVIVWKSIIILYIGLNDVQSAKCSLVLLHFPVTWSQLSTANLADLCSSVEQNSPDEYINFVRKISVDNYCFYSNSYDPSEWFSGFIVRSLYLFYFIDPQRADLFIAFQIQNLKKNQDSLVSMTLYELTLSQRSALLYQHCSSTPNINYEILKSLRHSLTDALLTFPTNSSLWYLNSLYESKYRQYSTSAGSADIYLQVLEMFSNSKTFNTIFLNIIASIYETFCSKLCDQPNDKPKESTTEPALAKGLNELFLNRALFYYEKYFSRSSNLSQLTNPQLHTSVNIWLYYFQLAILNFSLSKNLEEKDLCSQFNLAVKAIPHSKGLIARILYHFSNNSVSFKYHDISSFANILAEKEFRICSSLLFGLNPQNFV